MKLIYFDNAATTPVFEEAKNIFLEDLFANPSSIHSAGVSAMMKVERAREIIAGAINANAEQVYFTATGTEANNWVLKSLNSPKRSMVISRIEHPSIMETAKYLENNGFKIKYINVKADGCIDLEDAKDKISSEDSLCSVMHVNNETGIVQPIEELAKICRVKNVLIHVDACQSFTKIPIDFSGMNLDFLTINSSKINGPKGIGALIIKNHLTLNSFIHGGSQENGLRAGTLNLNAIQSFAKAVELSIGLDVSKKLKGLRDNMIQKMSHNFHGFKINGDINLLAPHILNIRFDNFFAKDIFWHLNKNKIYTSMSSACSANKFTPSYVLEAMGLSEAENYASIRISFGYFNSDDEIDIFIDTLGKLIK